MELDELNIGIVGCGRSQYSRNQTIRNAIIEIATKHQEYKEQFIIQLNCQEERAAELAATCIQFNTTRDKVICDFEGLQNIAKGIFDVAKLAFEDLSDKLANFLPFSFSKDKPSYKRTSKITARKSRVAIRRILRSRRRESHKKLFAEEEETM